MGKNNGFRLPNPISTPTQTRSSSGSSTNTPQHVAPARSDRLVEILLGIIAVLLGVLVCLLARDIQSDVGKMIWALPYAAYSSVMKMTSPIDWNEYSGPGKSTEKAKMSKATNDFGDKKKDISSKSSRDNKPQPLSENTNNKQERVVDSGKKNSNNNNNNNAKSNKNNNNAKSNKNNAKIDNSKKSSRRKPSDDDSDDDYDDYDDEDLIIKAPKKASAKMVDMKLLKETLDREKELDRTDPLRRKLHEPKFYNHGSKEYESSLEEQRKMHERTLKSYDLESPVPEVTGGRRFIDTSSGDSKANPIAIRDPGYRNSDIDDIDDEVFFNQDSFVGAQQITLQATKLLTTNTAANRKKANGMFSEALRLSPLALDARHRLAVAAWNLGDEDGALRHWTAHQDALKRLHERSKYGPLWDFVHINTFFDHGTQTSDVMPYKLRHDAEHFEHVAALLREQGEEELASDFMHYAGIYWLVGDNLRLVRGQYMREGNEHGYITLEGKSMSTAMGNMWGVTWDLPASLRLPPLPRDVPALAPRAEEDLARLLAEYERTGVVVVDDFLSPQALHAAWEMANRAPVWQEVKPWGYLGAYPTTGLALAHSVFLQIAKETPVVYKPLFDLIKTKHGLPEDDSTVYELGNMWAYKYDNNGSDTLRSGISVHANTDALVNVNMWLTPDKSYSGKKAGGGLVVYTGRAPPGWAQGYIKDSDAELEIRNLWRGRENVTVAYRQNRVVFFDAQKFHRSADYNFKRGYLHKRISLTYTYGHNASPDDER